MKRFIKILGKQIVLWNDLIFLQMIVLFVLLVVATTEADPKLHPYNPTTEASNEVGLNQYYFYTFILVYIAFSTPKLVRFI